MALTFHVELEQASEVNNNLYVKVDWKGRVNALLLGVKINVAEIL